MKTYQGSCHCGKVAYEVTMDLGEVIACNCSMCGRSGTLLTFVGADQFTLKSGEDQLTDYLFNKEHIHHKFCATCGIKSFATGKGPGGKDMYAINVRCLDGVDLDGLQVKHVDGRSL
jgi:hypothetical protein